MSSKRLQSAMEYLMTYSWALIIIAVAFASLFLLGVFNSTSNVNFECVIPGGFSCPVSYISQNGILFVNIFQTAQTLINVTALGCDTNGIVSNMQIYAIASQITLQNGGNSTFTVQCYTSSGAFSGALGSIYSGYLILNYTDLTTGIPQTVIGKVVAKISA